MSDPIPTINGEPAVATATVAPQPAPEPKAALTEQEVYNIVGDAIRSLVRAGTLPSTDSVRNLIRGEFINSSEFRYGIQQAVETALKNRQYSVAYGGVPLNEEAIRKLVFAAGPAGFRVTDEDIHALQLKQVHQAVAAFKTQISGQVQSLAAVVQRQNQLIIKLLRMSIAEQLKPEALQSVANAYEGAAGFESFNAPGAVTPGIPGLSGMAGIVAEEIQEISP